MDIRQLELKDKQEKTLRSKGFENTKDLVSFIPKEYIDISKSTGVNLDDERSILFVKLDSVTSYMRSRVVNASCTEYYTGTKIKVTWFGKLWLTKTLVENRGRYMTVCGKVSFDSFSKTFQIVEPMIFEPYSRSSSHIKPIYKKIPGIGDDTLKTLIEKSWNLMSEDDPLPKDVLDEMGVLNIKAAYQKIHFPKSMDDVKEGRKRLLYDTLLGFALKAEWSRRNSPIGSAFGIKTKRAYFEICKSLPYELTSDQQKAVDAMIKLASTGRRINALVQGDVGCGKTIVAVIMLALFADSGYQGALVAPTQVLARQHYEEVKKIVEPLGITVSFLGGDKLKAAEKRKLLENIKTGETKIVVGTHAAFSETVEYKNLAIAVFDEEHKFGVEQRNSLIKRAEAGVHFITMSATPIPRSLAHVIYGDSIELLTINEMPKGRMPVRTGIGKDREKVYKFIRKMAKQGHQTYVVCPMIDDKTDTQIKSVEITSKEFTEALSEDGIKVGTLTGRDSKEVTEETIRKFKDNEISVLVATTVVEVGVNIPTATMMVVTNAERFGLAQLHQLRGRVGRSSNQSYCVLESNATEGIAAERLNAMCTTNSGFEIAKRDLELRGSGEFLGTKQSGENAELKIILANSNIYPRFQEMAKKLIDRGDDCELVRNVMEEETFEN